MPEMTATRSLLIALGCLAAVIATGWIGASFRPGPWYEGLEKVAWNPPNWVFAPAWTLLYLMIAAVGWLIFTRVNSTWAGGLWLLQLVFNGLWSYLFFGLNNALAALLDISLLMITIAALMLILYPLHTLSFWLLVPYALWVAYATSLNAGIVWLNR